MKFSFSHTGDFRRTDKFLTSMQKLNIRQLVEPLAKQGVHALASATPRESGLAASSWSYEIEESKGFVRIHWLNHDMENGFPVAIMLQYGYGTGTGGYVHGKDYINPSIRPIFDSIADAVWKVVRSA